MVQNLFWDATLPGEKKYFLNSIFGEQKICTFIDYSSYFEDTLKILVWNLFQITNSNDANIINGSNGESEEEDEAAKEKAQFNLASIEIGDEVSISATFFQHTISF